MSAISAPSPKASAGTSAAAPSTREFLKLVRFDRLPLDLQLIAADRDRELSRARAAETPARRVQHIRIARNCHKAIVARLAEVRL